MDPYEIRRLAEGDAAALAEFYNGLSERSRRTFRPLGWATTVEACTGIVRAQVATDDALNQAKYDLVAWFEEWIVGWSFVWNLHAEGPTFGLGIADAHQGRGLGSALMDRVMEAVPGLGLRQVELTVVQDNLVARRLYEGRGFTRYGEFVDEKDGLAYDRMRKTL